MIRAALYARVSTEMQEKEQTIQSQLGAITQYAEAHQFHTTPALTYLDEGYSVAAVSIDPRSMRSAITLAKDALMPSCCFVPIDWPTFSQNPAVFSEFPEEPQKSTNAQYPDTKEGTRRQKAQGIAGK